jgi:predicted nucleotidyltransferase component of viral defense system
MVNSQLIIAKINNISHRENAPFDMIMVSFLLERAVARLIYERELKEHLCFKGGYVALRVYGSSRFTKDVDALIMHTNKENAIEKIKLAMNVDLDDGVWFKYHAQSPIKGQTEEGGIRFQYRAGLGSVPTNIVKAQIIDIDIGFGDSVVPEPREMTLLPLLGNQNLSWSVYSIETMLAEKLHCLIVLGSSSTRSKDVYDIWQFLPKASKSSLHKALKATFARRKDTLPDKVHMAIRNLDLTLLRRGWQSAAGYIKDAPDFNQTFEQVVSFLSEMDL